MSRRKLKTGFSTGTAAAAAAKAALEILLTGKKPESVQISLPQGGRIVIPVNSAIVHGNGSAEASVIKDAGDDPDVTNKAVVSAGISINGLSHDSEEIIIESGPGVGRVTRPGLPVAVGEPAINPVPRDMIRKSLRQAWAADSPGKGALNVRVVISVKDGEKMAKKTLNPRLGIVGGISILGTSGLVKPFSHEAYTSTIESALNVAAAEGLKEVVLTTGGKSEKYAVKMRPELPETAFIQIADYYGYALGEVRKRSLESVGLVSFFGKAVKQAQGLVYTHAHKAPLDLARLSGWLRQAGATDGLCREVEQANTARQALEIIRQTDALELVSVVGERMLVSARGFVGPEKKIRVDIIDYDGTLLYKGQA